MLPYGKIGIRRSSMVIIQATDGRIPLVRNDYKYSKTLKHKQKFPLWWKFPSGKLKKGETSEECAVREVQEETMILLDPKKLRWLLEEKTTHTDGTIHILTIFGIIIPKNQLEKIRYPFRGSTGEKIKIFSFRGIYRLKNKFHKKHVQYLNFFERKKLILPDFQGFPY